MPSQIEQLDREALVMLYLAGELSAEQRAEVERRVTGDPELAALLAPAREAQTATEAMLHDLDQRQRLPVNEGVAVRRVSRAMQQWQVNRLRRQIPPQRRHVAVPWWSYPAGAVAAVITIFLVWSTRQPIRPLPPDEKATQQIQLAEAESDALADFLEEGFKTDEVAVADTSAAPTAAPGAAGEDNGGFLIPPREDQAW